MDRIDHIAVSVADIPNSVEWYRQHFDCKVLYQDSTWAMLEFANIKMAMVVAEQHPPHIAFVSPDAAQWGALTGHRDGTRSVYVKDPAGNAVEVVEEATSSSQEPPT
jgi:catechol 2,3-dioxygenase-like lactoylglutathione lyase family enzyme